LKFITSSWGIGQVWKHLPTGGDAFSGVFGFWDLELLKSYLILISSRIAGNNPFRFYFETYCPFTLLDFKDNEINDFIQKWYRSRSPNKTE